MSAYYNEIDPFAAAWLRNLVTAGLICPGDIDERSIEDVLPSDLDGYTQCHFFAGIGVWSYALRNAGWCDTRPVWTGSCPCQPFSAAGKGAGFHDERHLWPAFHYLIDHHRPESIFGEQVASKDGLAWLDLVQADLEGTGYATWAADICAAGVGAPHIRQRLYWVAYDAGAGRERRWPSKTGDGRGPAWIEPERLCDARRVVNADGRYASAEGQQRSGQHGQQQGDGSPAVGMEHHQGDGWIERGSKPSGRSFASRCGADGLGNVQLPGLEGRRSRLRQFHTDARSGGKSVADRGSSTPVRPAPTNGFWRYVDWLGCRDDKWRPVEPGTFPLAHGAPARVGRLRGYGNAINAVQAQAFIEAAKELMP